MKSVNRKKNLKSKIRRLKKKLKSIYSLSMYGSKGLNGMLIPEESHISMSLLLILFWLHFLSFFHSIAIHDISSSFIYTNIIRYIKMGPWNFLGHGPSPMLLHPLEWPCLDPFTIITLSNILLCSYVWSFILKLIIYLT